MFSRTEHHKKVLKTFYVITTLFRVSEFIEKLPDLRILSLISRDVACFLGRSLWDFEAIRRAYETRIMMNECLFQLFWGFLLLIKKEENLRTRAMEDGMVVTGTFLFKVKSLFTHDFKIFIMCRTTYMNVK